MASLRTRAFSGGSSASLSSAASATGGDDLTGSVAVGGDQVECLEAGQHLGLVATEHRGHAGGLQRACLGHLGAAGRGQLDRVVRGDDARDRICGDLTDRVAGHRDVLAVEHAATGQFLMGEQGGGHDQGLGDRGVGDLLGGRGGSQAGQVQPTDLRPGGKTVGGTRQL